MNNVTKVNNNSTIPRVLVLFWARVFIPCLSLFIVCLNFALIYGLWKTNRVLNLSQKLYIYLACTDLTQCILSAFSCLFDLASVGTNEEKTLCFIIVRIVIMTFIACMVYIGSGTLILISMVRNLAIRKPLLKIKKRWLVKRLVFWVAYALVCCVFQLFLLSPVNRPTGFAFWGLLVTSCQVLILVICILSYNSWSMKKLLFQRPQSRSNERQRDGNHDDGSNIKCREGIRHKRNVKAVVTLFQITALYLVCFLPLCAFYFSMAILLQQKAMLLFNNGMHYFQVFNYLTFCCSGLNSIIYLKRDRKIIRYFKTFANRNFKTNFKFHNNNSSFSL